MIEAITSTCRPSWKQLSQAKEEQKIRILQKEKEREEQYEREREVGDMYNLTPMKSATKRTSRKNKGDVE
ncbi:uncharacterized protein MONOS_17548 [Monocercomonoides exilis]|uniref:uncharacterized protein n=1 Tax=Monocercomonoides exilis TaxID=2049356 RepID=UPI00355A2A0C|nr:hypothetical protein MONOS_17548 [Monocercomonoides exilis]